MPVRTWVGRFCVVGGRVEEEGPWLGSLIRQRPDDDADELYVLVEPARAGSEEYTSQLVDVVLRLYGKDPLSLTGGLLRSLRAAHDHLREWNRRSLKEHRIGAGSTSLALRGREAYLAQIGPALAYVRGADGAFRRIEHDIKDFERALGVAEEFEPRLTRIELQPGDLVLLASTRLDAVAPAAHIEKLLERDPDDALPELYLLCRDEPDMAVVLLSCFEQEEAPPEFLTRDGTPGAAPTASAPAAPPVEAVAAGAVSLNHDPEREPALASVGEAAIGGFDLPRRPIHEEVKEITADVAPPPSANVRIRGGDAAPRYKKSTGAVLPQFRIPKLAIFAAAALVLLGLVAWWQLPGSVKESREDRFVTLIADARQANARAQATSDPGLKRQLLTEAQASLTDAEKIHDDNGELLALRADVEAAIGTLDNVSEVRGFTPVADMEQVATGALSITQTVTGGGSAYMIDAEEHRVLRLPLDGGAPETVLQEGEAGFLTPGRPVSISWSADTGALLILDDKRQVFGHFPGRGTLPVTVRGADGWASGDAVATSGPNLYVLDVAGNQVWRYLPGQGFDSERTALLDGADLANATELAVGENVYILDRELGIRRFVERLEAPFPLAGIDRPLMEPASLSVLPGSNRLIVADRGNKRIVVASADGEFMKQIVSPSFTDLRAVSVDEGSNTLYVLNGNTLLKAPFPP